MERGTIIDYIDNQRMICAVVLESIVSGNRHLRLLNENDRDVRLPARRVSHAGGFLDPDAGRTALVDMLRSTAARREEIAQRINIQSLWELVRDEGQWLDLKTMTELCFSEPVTPDHEAALVRAFFADRLYFKFDHERFFPHTEEEVKAILARREKEERLRRLVNEGAAWLKDACRDPKPELVEGAREVVEILADFYLFGKEAGEYSLAKKIIAAAGGISPDTLFSLLVRLGIWDKNENTDLLKHEVPVSWPDKVIDTACELAKQKPERDLFEKREDLTGLEVITIDGPSTLDFDDALSIEQLEDGSWMVGIHISDVAACIERGSLVDAEALKRGSSIYTADLKIPMLPPALSEGLCSLAAGENRPAISVLARFTPEDELADFRITASVIRVGRHLTYDDTDAAVGSDSRITRLASLSRKLRERRLKEGALIIDLPEIAVVLGVNGKVDLRRIDRASPSRTLVEEMMILANWLTARFLYENGIPAIFRTQGEPRNRLLKKGETNSDLFTNWVQRKMLAHVSLCSEPGRHCGLGVDMYTTATSPIRKYTDLVTQRQVRAALGLEKPYNQKEIEGVLQALEKPLGYVGKIQQARQRYWVLKHLEKRVGEQIDAMVLDKVRNDYLILLPDCLIECRLSAPTHATLQPRDTVRIQLRHVNARQDVVSVFFG